MIRTLSRVLLLSTCLLAPGWATSPAFAQVAVDQGALEQLKALPAPSEPAKVPSTPTHHAKHPAAKAKANATAASSAPAAKPTVKPGAPARPAPIAIAPAPPPPVSLAVPVLPPPHAVSELPIPIVANAAGDASKIVGGLRVTFGAGSSDLNPATAAALRIVARTIGTDAAATFNVYAYAAGSADDPSTPRRLSLSRGLAARAVLISEGIASTRIYVRALGATVTDGPQDRVDVTQVGIAPSPS